MMPNIPYELIVEILVRLPLDSLMQFRSVCKAWHFMITKDPQFLQHCANYRQLCRFNHLYERLSYFGLPEHVTELKKRISLHMCWSGQVPTRLLRTPDTDVDVLLERALKYAGMRKTLAELKDRMSYERWVVAACNPEYLDGSLEPPLPPRVLKAFKNGVQIDEYDEVYKLLMLYGLTMHINELKHRISIRTRYLVTQLQGAELVESSPISRLKEVLRYNGFHELLKYLEYRIANDNRGGSRDALTRNPRPSALALVAPRMFGDHNEYIDAEDHGEHAAAGGVRIQLATAAASGVPSQHAGGGSESPIQHTASG